MSQLRDKQRNNVKAGVFVLLSLILGLVVISVLTNLWETITVKTNRFHASFSIRDGVSTLASGSQVRLGGLSIGSVTTVSPSIVNDTPISEIDVYFDINADIQLYSNLSLEVHSGLLGSKAWLSINDVGEGDLATSDTILTGSSSSMLGQFLGSEADQDIQETLEALRKISNALTEDGDVLRMILGNKEADEISQAITSAKNGLQSIQELSISLETVWPTWETSISSLLETTKDLPTKIDATLTDVQKMIGDIRVSILPKVEQTMASLEATSKSLASMTKILQESSPRWSDKITSILSNVDQVTARAKSAVDDISASPWRLLYRPTDREIAYEQLNDASWQLLTALSDLRASSEDLRALVSSADSPIDAHEAASLSEELRESETAFRAAREAILERMHIDFPDRTFP
jgi:ABC-type transporter Mla subunit MlaD